MSGVSDFEQAASDYAGGRESHIYRQPGSPRLYAFFAVGGRPRHVVSIGDHVPALTWIRGYVAAMSRVADTADKGRVRLLSPQEWWDAGGRFDGPADFAATF